jgi:hypothetical protein
VTIHHRTNPRDGVDHHVLAHLTHIESRGPKAERIVTLVLSVLAASLIVLIGVIVLPGTADMAELAPGTPIEAA